MLLQRWFSGNQILQAWEVINPILSLAPTVTSKFTGYHVEVESRMDRVLNSPLTTNMQMSFQPARVLLGLKNISQSLPQKPFNNPFVRASESHLMNKPSAYKSQLHHQMK